MKKILITFLMGALLLLNHISTADAAITVIRQYHLGEADSGAMVGATATNSVDSVGGNDLTLFGSPVYSPDAASNDTNSFLSLTFNGTNYGTATLMTNTDNFGVEAWVKTSAAAGSHFAAYNGNTGSSGWGFLQNNSGNVWSALFGGAAVFGNGAVTTDQWTCLALVRDEGVATFYVNGAGIATSTAAPNAPAGSFAVGATPENPPTGGFVGQIDDVRVFTFSPGAFQTNDLLYNNSNSATTFPPGPMLLDLTASNNNIRLSWQTSAPPLILEYTPELSQPFWTVTTNVIVTNNATLGLFLADEMATNQSRFYRLWEYTNEPPVPVVTFYDLTVDPGRNNGLPVHFSDVPDDNSPPVCDYNDDGMIICTLENTVYAGDTNRFDTSQMIDPRTGANSLLSFHWEIFFPDAQGGGLYAARGVTGYHSSILTIAPNSMPDLPSDINDYTTDLWRVKLTVTSQPLPPYDGNSSTNVYWFRFIYVASQVSLQMSANCQACNGTNACPDCSFENARPPLETP